MITAMAARAPERKTSTQAEFIDTLNNTLQQLAKSIPTNRNTYKHTCRILIGPHSL